MKLGVRYCSRSGNTKKLAEAIAEVAGCAAKAIDEPFTDTADILFLGGALYAGGLDKKLQEFLTALTDYEVKKVAVFSTAASEKSIHSQVKILLEGKNIKVLDEYFHCKGKFLLAHRNRPNQDDLSAVKRFAENILANGEK